MLTKNIAMLLDGERGASRNYTELRVQANTAWFRQWAEDAKAHIAVRYPAEKQEWIRALVEDVLVCGCAFWDASDPTAALIDPVTIKHVRDERGKVPTPPDPAFEQVINGRPIRHFQAGELVYIRAPGSGGGVYPISALERMLNLDIFQCVNRAAVRAGIIEDEEAA